MQQATALTLACALVAMVAPNVAALPPSSGTATFYESEMIGWELTVVAPDCDSGGVRELVGIYDNGLSWVDFGVDGLACAIILYDGHGGAGESVTCAPGTCKASFVDFNDRASSYRVIAGDADTDMDEVPDDAESEACGPAVRDQIDAHPELGSCSGDADYAPPETIDGDDDRVPDAAEEHVCGRDVVADTVNEAETAGHCDASDDYASPDQDTDTVLDEDDNCPNMANTDQDDADGDGVGDVCDPDRDGDGTSNGDDAFPSDPAEQTDSDGDGAGDNGDNCVTTANPTQADTDADGTGDACDPDLDNDGVPNGSDNCPVSNPGQADSDGDALGNACDPDRDGDDVPNEQDAAPDDPDRDDDGPDDGTDNCPDAANTSQTDRDGDGPGDACDSNADGDAFEDATETQLCRVEDQNLDEDGHCHGENDYHAPGDDNHEG